MKFTAESPRALTDTIRWAAQGVASRPTWPVPARLLITATGHNDLVRFSGSDHDVGAAADTIATVAEPGSALIPANLLASIMRALPDKPLSFTLGENDRLAELECGSATFHLASIPLDGYPSLPVLPAPVARVGSDQLARLAGQVVFAASRDENAQVLHGVNTHITGGMLAMTATDRYRLATGGVPCEMLADADDWPPALIRADVLDRFAKALPGGTDVDISMGTSSDGYASLAGFTAAGRSLSVRLLSGEFPSDSARRLLGMPVSATAVMDALEVAQAVARAEVVSVPGAGVTVTFTAGEAKVTGSDGEGAREEETFPCDFDGPDLVTIRVNPKFLRAAVEAVQDERVAVEFTSAAPRIVIRAYVPPAAQGDDALAYRHLLMPIKAGDAR